MILNAGTVVYVILSACLAALGAAAAALGLRVAASWTGTSPGSERRFDLERRGYLVSTLLAVGLLFSIVLIPAWFATLASLVPSVPGAMCLTGVHMVRPEYAFPATIAKFFLPGAFLAWMLLRGLDARDRRQPHAAGLYRALPAVALLLALVSSLDVATLVTIEPRRVGCCTSLFDDPPPEVPVLLKTSTVTWTWAVLAILAASLVILRWRRRRPRLRRFLALLAPAGLLVFLFALHTRLAPDILRTPYHHCVFCLFRDSWPAVLGSGAIVSGFWMAGALGFSGGRELEPEAVRYEAGVACLATALLAAGTLLIGAAWAVSGS